MAFRLDREPLPAGIRRIAVEQLDVAGRELCGDTDLSWDQAVHSVRKRLKQLRAVVRLVRDDLGEEVARRDGSAFRDAGRALSTSRDAAVLVATLTAVGGETSFPGLRGDLLARAAAARRRAEADDASQEVAARLRAARERVAAWPLVRDDPGVLADGLARSQRRGRRGMAAAYAQPDGERFHEWRKRVKDLWYHLRLLEGAWPAVLGATAEEAHRLSDLLGDEHDLGVLGEVALAEGLGTGAERAALAPLLGSRRAGLRREARPLGLRLYAEPPARCAERLAGYWQTWRAEG
jgi:CHAD domain-containing protein